MAQTEADWADTAPHPISFTRHYKSQGNVNGGLGASWSHNWATRVSKADLEAAVRFGDGTKVFFTRQNVNQPWVAGNGIDTLVETATGLLYTRASDETRYQFDAAQRLAAITQRNGWSYTLGYGPDGSLTTVTNALGRTLQFTHASGLLASVGTPDGKTIAYSYDAIGRLAGVTHPDSATRQYHYEDSRHPAALTGLTNEASVRVITYGYDEHGRAISSQAAGGVRGVSVTYPAQSSGGGTLVAGTTVDPSIYRVTTQVTDALGNVETYVWQGGDGQVRLLGAGSPANGSQFASRSFIGRNLPESETDFMGMTTTYTWDVQRQLKLSTTKAAGTPEAQSTSTQWHISFRLPVLITEAGRSTAFTYDASGNKLSEEITDMATGAKRTWGWTYTSQGLNDTMTDPLGRTWRYGHDAHGNRTSVKDPAGTETRYTFDAAGRVLTQMSLNRPATAFTYDARGRLLSQATGGEVTRYTYEPTGLLASISEPGGMQVSYTYDSADRLIAAQDNRGASIQYTLDAAGNRIREEVRNPDGSIALVTARLINNLNRVAAIQGAQSQTTQLGYDANGEPTSQTDPLNQTTRQTLDALRRTRATTFPDNAAATQAWNQLDQLTQVTDPKGVATTYTTNAFGEVMSETSPDIGTISYTRDAAGQVIAMQDAKGQITSITRDALGRPTEIRYAADHVTFLQYNGAGDVTRIEDKSGATAYERDDQGRLLTKTQSVHDNPANPSSFKVGYAHANGQLASITYPSGLKLFYQRNAAGQITGIDAQEPGGTVRRPKPIVQFLTGLTHTAMGQPKGWRWSNGDSASRTFDADGRMIGNEFATYGYDAAGRLTAITQSLVASSTATGTLTYYTTPFTWTAGYDSRNRLTSFIRDGAETRYSYDPNSNRLTAVNKVTSDTDLDGQFDETDFALATSQSLNIEAQSNRLLGLTQTVTRTNAGRTRSVVTTPVAYRLDANGSMTSDGLRDFEYDASGRLARVRVFKDGEAAQVKYLHNALGQRVFKSEPQAEQTLPTEQELGTDFITWLRKQFGWMFAQAQANTSIGTAYVFGDGQIPPWALLGEYDNGSSTGAGRTEYLWLPTEDGNAIPIGMYRGGRFFAIHSDHLGTPRLITNEQNKPVWQWPYSAFGNNKPTGILKATPNPRAAITNQPVLLKATGATEMNLRFPGQYFDQEAGTKYNYFRDYDATQGRYRQADPIGLEGGLSRFSYSDLSPLGRWDAFGLATYQCKRNLENFLFSVGPLFHQYVCTGSEGTGFSCKGLTASGSILNSNGKFQSEAFNPESCEKVEDDNKSLEDCIATEFNKAPPNYSVNLQHGENCQTFANQVVAICRARTKGASRK